MTIRSDDVMADIEASVRDALRRRLIAAGGPAAYRDAEIFASVNAVLARAVERRGDPEGGAAAGPPLLLPELLGDEEAWRPAGELRITSHRPLGGPLIVFVKRRLVLPLVRWLFEYADENFRRQEYVNRIVMACLEELAIENARLRSDVAALEEQAGRSR